LLIYRVLLTLLISYLPRDATQSAVLLQQVVCPSFSLWHWGYRDHTGWNSSKI